MTFSARTERRNRPCGERSHRSTKSSRSFTPALGGHPDSEMTRRFWVLTVVWILAIVATAPVLIEVLDDAGLGLRVPGLSVTGSEILLAGLLAAAPPLIVAFFIRRRSRLA